MRYKRLNLHVKSASTFQEGVRGPNRGRSWFGCVVVRLRPSGVTSFPVEDGRLFVFVSTTPNVDKNPWNIRPDKVI